MTNNSYDKIKLIILRAALVLIGASTGFLAVWQYFTFYPQVVKREYQIVITVVSSALVALIFGLSAKAVYRLAESVVNAVKGLKDRMGARGIIAVALGFAAAVALVVAFDFVIRIFLDIWAVRLLADVLVYILSATGCSVGFTKWLTAPKTEKSEKADAPAVGYLLAAECFKDERVLTAVHTLINVKVTGGAYKALCLYGGEGGTDAARLMDALIGSGAVTVINTNKTFDSASDYEQLEKQIAKSKRLKRVSPAAAEKELSLELFAPPTAEMKQAIAAQKQDGLLRASDKQNSAQSEQSDDVNGQIIIDK